MDQSLTFHKRVRHVALLLATLLLSPGRIGQAGVNRLTTVEPPDGYADPSRGLRLTVEVTPSSEPADEMTVGVTVVCGSDASVSAWLVYDEPGGRPMVVHLRRMTEPTASGIAVHRFGSVTVDSRTAPKATVMVNHRRFVGDDGARDRQYRIELGKWTANKG